jgi:DNA modification methylase
MDRTRPSERRDPRRWRVVHADCLEALPSLVAESVDVVITDPPYGINIKGMAWDRPAPRRGACPQAGRPDDGDASRAPRRESRMARHRPRGGAQSRSALAFEVFCRQWAGECLRVLKPGGHLAAFGSPRTVHRLACGLEDAGFELRDVVMWLYGQGFPKSRNLSGRMKGWGTALRPSYEPILLARKPPSLPTQANALRHGTGALHIDAARIPDDAGCPEHGRTHRHDRGAAAAAGRWPPNVAFSHGSSCTEAGCASGCPAVLLGERERFFYCAKASRREREAGCERLSQRTIQTFQIGAANERRAKARPVANVHPTVKPLELMRWLVRLMTPPDGLVLDPFAGSGSTGAAAVIEGARFIGIEREADYLPIARARIAHWAASTRPRGGACR